jgi:hypothetical protein
MLLGDERRRLGAAGFLFQELVFIALANHAFEPRWDGQPTLASRPRVTSSRYYGVLAAPMITTTRMTASIPTPIQPSTIPAIAIPRPS